MKKTVLTIAIILGLGLATFAVGDNNHQGGLFYRGAEPREYATPGGGSVPMLPAHNQSTNQSAPIGSGIVVLLGMGAAYLVGKKHREE